MIEIIENPKRKRDDTLLLVVGIQRLDPLVHERLIERLLHECPFDYAIYEPPHKPEYDEILSHGMFWGHRIQIFKLWDILQEVPEKYKFIVRGRNDVRFCWNKTEQGHYREIGKILVDSVDRYEMNAFCSRMKIDKYFRAAKRRNFYFLGDLLMVFKRDTFLNPYEKWLITPTEELSKVLEDKQETTHHGDIAIHKMWWHSFTQRPIALEMNIDIIRNGDTIDFYVAP